MGEDSKLRADPPSTNRPSFIHVLCAFGILLAATGRLASAEPDLLRPANLKTICCGKPDPRYMFLRSSRSGNVFHPGEAVDLTVEVTRGDKPLRSISLAVIEIATPQNRYLEGMSTMTAPAAVEVVRRVGRRAVPVTVADRKGATAGYAWMGGWALRRYDTKGKTLRSVKLPQVCVGMDAIPGGKGVMLGYFEKAHIHHDNADGLLIGRMEPGAAAGKTTGWTDNTSAVAVSRDPRDGMLDVFGEDSWLNRNIWYRVDDRKIEYVTGTIEVK